MRHRLTRGLRSFVAAAAVGATISTALAVPAYADSEDDLPPSERVTVDLVTVIGSGCPEGTAAVAAAPDNTAFTVTYSDYTAQIGGGAAGADFRKNCQLNVLVKVPQGFTYAIAAVDYRGYAHLQRNVRAHQRANYYFQGHPQTVRVTHNLRGPFSEDWQVRDEAGIGAIVYAPCGERRLLAINTELRIDPATANPSQINLVTMDSTDGSIHTIYRFRWKRC
jgi:Domain of unknown function (DUF4360)